MPERSRWALCVLAIVALALPPGGGGAAAAGAPAVSVRSGRWSDPATWVRRAVPGPSLGVRIARGTVVEYDVHSDGDLGPIAVAGTLAFSRRRPTRMDAAGVIVEAGGVLQMGRPGHPIPAGVTAEIRLVVAEGQTFQGGDFVASDVGIWVMRGGRWEVNGAPLRYTWAKLARTAPAGDRTVLVAEDLSDWPAGGQLLITPTAAGPTAEAFEERALVGVRRVDGGLFALDLSSPLAQAHEGGGEISGEVALLSRNVAISSKYPLRTRGHTAYMAGAAGSIAYAEFRDLGTLGVLGRYPIHFHMMGEGSRGMSVRGASIWRSGNHFLNIHGSNGITVADTVGYGAPGHGFFVERTVERHAPAPRRKREVERARSAKGEGSGANVGTVFIHTLGAMARWRPGSLDEPRRIALFWISSLNMTLIDNVAVGASGGRDSAGFHLAEGQDYTPAAAPLTMVHNEARGNSGHGFFSWTNAKAELDIVDLRSYRNGRSGASIGAYNNRLRLFNSRLLENGVHNLGIWVTRTWVQDSLLARSPVGVFFHPHPVSGNPETPTVVARTRFLEHSAAHIAQDHRSCPQPEEERRPASRQCAANYAVFLRPEFGGGRALDFGWHENAHSWIDLVEWQSTPAELPSSVRVIRRDQQEDGSRPYEPFEARIRPLQRGVDAPPTVQLTARPQGGREGVMLRAQADDDGGVAAVEFFADGVLLGRLTAPPYELVWRPGAESRSVPLVYARAIDRSGQVAYSAVTAYSRAGR